MPYMNAAIVGVGKLGSIHLRIYRELADINTTYICDSDPHRLAQFPDAPACSDYRSLIGKVDLVSIAAPTPQHYAIAKFFLAHKIPVLVEKPLTQNLQEARALIALSQKYKTQLCVGHVERYNNAYLAIQKIIKNPRFIECHRLSPYPFRSTDISVVLDLMIHDLDIIRYLVKSSVRTIAAKGVTVLSKNADIANARITFTNGCVANITASRISDKKERKLRIFTDNCYISMDYAEQAAHIYTKIKNKTAAQTGQFPYTIQKEEIPINKEEPLKNEIRHFVALVHDRRFNIEYAKKAADALELALKVQKLTQKIRS